MLQGSIALSEFRTSLSKVLTLWHCVKVKQRYHTTYIFYTYCIGKCISECWNQKFCHFYFLNHMWWIVQPLTSDHQWNINSVQLVNVVGLCTKKGCPLRGTAPTGLLQRGSCQFRSRRAAVSFAFQQTFIPSSQNWWRYLITNGVCVQLVATHVDF